AAREQSSGFHFVAMGDMPYNVPKDYKRLERLIGKINQDKPAFVVHVGDIKNGTSACTNARFMESFKRYRLIQAPFVLTPGDSEWTDCGRQADGNYDSVERLQALRQIFYGPQSGLTKNLPITRQSVAYPENVRWWQNGVYFATLHIVGSNNNLAPGLQNLS